MNQTGTLLPFFSLFAQRELDGYTLLCGNISSLIVQPIMAHNRDVETARSFIPIARLSQNVEGLVVNPNFPAQSVQELGAYAKANPNKLNYGSGGQGNISELAAELFRLRTGVDIVHVPACDLVVGASPFEQQFERFNFRRDPSLMEGA